MENSATTAGSELARLLFTNLFSHWTSLSLLIAAYLITQTHHKRIASTRWFSCSHVSQNVFSTNMVRRDRYRNMTVSSWFNRLGIMNVDRVYVDIEAHGTVWANSYKNLWNTSRIVWFEGFSPQNQMIARRQYRLLKLESMSITKANNFIINFNYNFSNSHNFLGTSYAKQTALCKLIRFDISNT